MRQYTLHGAQSPQLRPEGTETTAGESDASSDYWAVFGQATWRFADQWHMVLGGRYSYEEADTYRRLALERRADGHQRSQRWTSTTSRRGSPSAGSRRSNVLAYLTASRGFKSGGTQSSNNINLSNQFEPEVLWNYEAGLSSICSAAGCASTARCSSWTGRTCSS